MAIPSATTTLMTFLVRTPLTTRSVSLFGSWDNFAKGYRMEKDPRTGRGHWRGCHTFTNIICDGHGNAIYPGRDGGLKMGGTYWYYYLLDGDIDFYNESEAWTTSCPLLPGQPLNVLNVPIYLPPAPTSHNRNDSASSQLSMYQTMNPDDKYVNPRPPPRPQMPRLVTSPAAFDTHGTKGVPISPSSAHLARGRSVSQPRENTRKFMVGGKLSLDLKLPMSSFAPKSSGLRSAFFNRLSPHSATHEHADKHTEPKTSVPKIDLIRSTPVASQTKNHCSRLDYHGTTAPSSTMASPCGSPADLVIDDRLLVPGAYDKATNNNINYQRDGTKPSPSYPTNHMRWVPDNTTQTPTAPSNTTNFFTNSPTSGTLIQTTDVSYKPKLYAPATYSQTHLYSKRLPTLPSSPSSDIDEDYAAMFASAHQTFDLDRLHSHFSRTTVDSSPRSPLLPGGSRFSECSSTDTEFFSPSSMTSSSTFNNEAISPVHFKIPRSTSLDSSLSSLSKEKEAEASSLNHDDTLGIRDRHIDDEFLAGIEEEPPFWMSSDPFSDEKFSARVSGNKMGSIEAQDDLYRQDPADITIHNMMQELIDEMGYLGNMIDQAEPNDI